MKFYKYNCWAEGFRCVCLLFWNSGGATLIGTHSAYCTRAIDFDKILPCSVAFGKVGWEWKVDNYSCSLLTVTFLTTLSGTQTQSKLLVKFLWKTSDIRDWSHGGNTEIFSRGKTQWPRLIYFSKDFQMPLWKYWSFQGQVPSCHMCGHPWLIRQ